MDTTLTEKYEQTDYIVDDDPPIVMRIGERHDGIRILFASFGVESAAFLTAWNPGGQQLELDTNFDRQAELLSEVEQLRLNYFVGRGQHPTEDWCEDSYLVLGISRDDANRLAAQFEQNAYVWVPNTGIPELVPVGQS